MKKIVELLNRSERLPFKFVIYKLQNIWKSLNLDPKVRAEDLKVTDWLEIAAKSAQ